MADAKIKKIKGNDTKIKNIFCKIVNVSFWTERAACNLSVFGHIYICGEVMVKYEFS